MTGKEVSDVPGVPPRQAIVRIASGVALAVTTGIALSIVIRDGRSFTPANTLLLVGAAAGSILAWYAGHTVAGLAGAIVLLGVPALLLLLGGTGVLYLPSLIVLVIALGRRAVRTRQTRNV